MATTTDNKGAAQQQPQSARDRYRGRYSAAHPDLNLDDEEAFYSQANKNLDELENFREANQQIGVAFDKTPLLAGLVLAAKEGEDPFTYLAENIGSDMDIRELANDPEFSKKMGAALAKHQETMANAAKATEEAGKNWEQSMTALNELQQERGMSDEERIALIKKLFGEIDPETKEIVEPGIIGNAAMGIVPKEVWEAVLKAQNYDSDIAAATDKARATALNEHFSNEKRNFQTPGVPSLGSGGAGGRVGKKKQDDGSLRAFQESLGV
jgi:hypothetical protein